MVRAVPISTQRARPSRPPHRAAGSVNCSTTTDRPCRGPATPPEPGPRPPKLHGQGDMYSSSLAASAGLGDGGQATGWPVLPRARRTSRLARHAVAEVDDSRAEGAGPGEFEIHPAPALGKERNATANQHRVDPGPVLVDQTQRGRLGGESRAADRDVALRRLGSQPFDLLRQAAGSQAGSALHSRQRGGEHYLWERLPERGPLEL